MSWLVESEMVVTPPLEVTISTDDDGVDETDGDGMNDDTDESEYPEMVTVGWLQVGGAT
jgi:hypothetical protein